MMNWQAGESSTALAEQDADRYWRSTDYAHPFDWIGFPTYGLYYYVVAIVRHCIGELDDRRFHDHFAERSIIH